MFQYYELNIGMTNIQLDLDIIHPYVNSLLSMVDLSKFIIIHDGFVQIHIQFYILDMDMDFIHTNINIYGCPWTLNLCF